MNNPTLVPRKIVWDTFWRNGTSLTDKILGKVYYWHIWNGYKRFLSKLNIDSPLVLELGCGTGMMTLRMLKFFGSGSAVLVDFSKEALKIAKRNFSREKFGTKFVKEDIFRFSYSKSFDIVHSEGVVEHFSDGEMLKIVEKHKDFAKVGGYVIIFVPTPTWYYNLWKRWLEKREKWPCGYEKALKKKELIDIVNKAGLLLLDAIKIGRCVGILAKKY